MKIYFSIFVLAMTVIVWGCNPKKHEKTAEEIAATEDSLKQVKATELAERKTRLREARDTKAAQRRTAIEEKSKTSPTYKDAAGNVVYYKVEVEPKYAGGEEAMTKYLQDNLKYPESARKEGLEGTVFVDFVIDKKGAVRDVTATETTLAQVDSALVAEAVRVVSAMPAWTAGTQSGKPADVGYSIPITFELEN
jgi:TonB family protein